MVLFGWIIKIVPLLDAYENCCLATKYGQPTLKYCFTLSIECWTSPHSLLWPELKQCSSKEWDLKILSVSLLRRFNINFISSSLKSTHRACSPSAGVCWTSCQETPEESAARRRSGGRSRYSRNRTRPCGGPARRISSSPCLRRCSDTWNGSDVIWCFLWTEMLGVEQQRGGSDVWHRR